MADVKDITQLSFVKGFIKLCNDGWKQGWHERNGGNLTYRLTNDEVELAKPFFAATPSEWIDLGLVDDYLGGSYFLSTGSGKFMRNVEDSPQVNIAVVQINAQGSAYRIVWGLTDGAKPTSEFPTHYMNHVVRTKKTADSSAECRVIYHAHPANVIAMSAILPWDSKLFTRKFWQAMTECVVIFPDGVGVVPWMVPGGAEIAHATSRLMEKYEAAIWGLHGMFVSGRDFDITFGLMHTIEKAAEIYMIARSANGGSDDFMHVISDEELLQVARDFNIKINQEFLD